jgi:uncharacterized protein (DUF2062 family)
MSTRGSRSSRPIDTHRGKIGVRVNEPPKPGRKKLRQSLAELLYRLRTEATQPASQAMSVGLGAFIGVFPVYGFHLPLCVVLSRALRLNLITMFLTTNLNNPFFAPLLVYAELQVGGLLRNGEFHHHTLETVRQLRLLDFAADLVVGSIVVGLTAGLTLGLATLSLARRASRDRERNLLIENTARRFLDAGYLQWEATRAVLRRNHPYVDLVRSGVLSHAGTIYHVRCGRGLLLVLHGVFVDLSAARTAGPDGGPGVAHPILRGVDDRKRLVRVARIALGSEAVVEEADPAGFEFSEPGSIVLSDVLRRCDERQRALIMARAISAVGPRDVLVVCEKAPGLWSRWRRAGVTARQIEDVTTSAGLETVIMSHPLTWARRRYLLVARRVNAQESS